MYVLHTFYEKYTKFRVEHIPPGREILKRPSTPPRLRRTGQFAKGVGESVVETAKLPVNLLVLSAKLLGGAAHSLATWEDKLGIGEKITDASELISAFGQELKYEWENPEEYRERVEKAQALRKELDQAERALNAEAYHNQDDRELGYWSGAALQTVFGEEIIKQVAKGVSTTAKAAKVAGKVAEVSKVEARASALGAAGRTGKEVAAKGGNYLNDTANISSFSDEIANLNKATSGGGIIQNTSASQIVASASYYSTPLEQGSAIFRGIIQNHLFINGNHRTAVAAFRSFASKNGIKVGLSDSELMNIAKQVSAGQLDDVCSIGAALSK